MKVNNKLNKPQQPEQRNKLFTITTRITYYLLNNNIMQADDVRKAIIGVSSTWDFSTKRKAFQDTQGILGNQEEVD